MNWPRGGGCDLAGDAGDTAGILRGGVRAIRIVEGAHERFGAPVYVRRAIVHNPHVVAQLEALGAVVVPEVDEVPAGAVVVFSAHGVGQEVRAAAAARGLEIVDATCPLVMKAHREVRRFLGGGYDVVLIGHAGHDEMNGTLGQAAGRIQLVETAADVEGLVVRDPGRVACVTQTTLSRDDVWPAILALRARFPRLAQPDGDDIQATGIVLAGLPLEEVLFFLLTNLIVAQAVTLFLAPELTAGSPGRSQ